MVELDQVSVGDIVRTLYDDGDSPWCISHANQQARVLDVRPSRGDRPVLVEYLYWPSAGDLHWLYLDQFEILNRRGGAKLNKATDLKVGDKVRITDVNVGLEVVDANLGKVVEVIEVDQGDPKIPIKVKFLSGDWKGYSSWIDREYFHRIIPGEPGVADHSTISVGDVVRIVYGDYGNEMMVDNDGKLAKVVEVNEGALIMPIRVEFLQGRYKGRRRGIEKWMYELIGEESRPLNKAANDSAYRTELVEEEVEEVEVDKIKEGDFVVIDTTHSEDTLLEGLHGKVVKVIEVDAFDKALPICVALPNGDDRWMYPEEFYAAPTEDFNISVDSGKGLWYGEASGSVVPVIEVDYDCPMGFFFKVKSDGELLWVNRTDCTVLLPEGEDPELFNEEVELDFTVIKKYTNGEVSTFIRIDKQSAHFYDGDLLAEFNNTQDAPVKCKSISYPGYYRTGYSLLALRGTHQMDDSREVHIPEGCLEQVVTTLVDLKDWMLNRCKR